MAFEGRGQYDPAQPQAYGYPPHQQHHDQPSYDSSQPPVDPRYQYAPPPYPPNYAENQATQFPPPPGYRHQSPPHLFDAVNQAVDKVEPVRPPETTAAQLPPELLQQITSQITETVKNQILHDLKASLPQAHQAQAPPPPPPTYQPQSPAPSSSRPVYTPESRDADASDESDEEEVEAPSRPPPRNESPEVVRKEDLAGRLGDRSVPPEERSRSRPAIPRMMTNDEVTTLEKIWQPLFTSDGQPTSRLSQFLRGLALHLVEDYEPQKSLVIPPHKMQRFYDEVNIESEPYPWRDLFTKLPHATLSRIYRSLGCAHHFIQSNVRNEPTIPALTPEGFCTWLTLLIQAHPDSEFSRLACAVRDMPISNADDRKERFPKELSRRLFPKHYDSKVRERCNVALNPPTSQPYAPGPPAGPPNGPSTGTAPRDIPERPRDQSIPASVASAPTVGSYPERERAPYGSSFSNTTFDRFSDRNSRVENFRSGSDAADSGPGSVVSDSAAYPGTSPLERVTSIPIERERKPYVAKEGQGKVYGAGTSNTANSSNSTIRPEQTQLNIEEEAKRSRRRSNSQAASMQPPFSSSRGNGPPVSSLSAGLGRSDTRRNRSPSNSVSSNSFNPPSGAASQIYSGSEDDSQARDARRRDRDRETEDERRDRKERERRREREKEREREEEREKSRRREKERDSDDEYHERRGERDRERDREREKEQERRRKEDEKLERERERAAAEYRRAAEERDRYEDDGRPAYSEPPAHHHHHRRPTNPGSNGYGPAPGQYVPQPPLGGGQRGGY